MLSRKFRCNLNYIKINKNKCKACYLCVEVCPKKLIKKGEETNNLGAFPVEFDDPENQCLGCTLCAIRCPDLAIEEVVKGE